MSFLDRLFLLIVIKQAGLVEGHNMGGEKNSSICFLWGGGAGCQEIEVRRGDLDLKQTGERRNGESHRLDHEATVEGYKVDWNCSAETSSIHTLSRQVQTNFCGNSLIT